MGTFVTDDTPLPANRTNAPGYGAGSKTYQADAALFNAMLGASDDLRNHTRGFVHVKSHGADGDGVTDETEQIAAAFTAAAGKRVVFEAGKTYLFSAPFTPASGTKIEGRATLKAVATGIVSAAFNLTDVSDVEVSDLTIDGSTNAGGTVGLAFGVVITGGSNNEVHGLRIHDTFSEAIKVDSGTGHYIHGNWCIDNGRASSLEDHGIAIVAVAGDVSIIRVEGNHVDGANRKGIGTYAAEADGYSVSDVSIIGNNTTNCGLGGIFVAVEPSATASRNIVVSNNTSFNDYTGIAASAVSGLTVTGNVVRSPTHVGMDLDSLDGGVVCHNSIDKSDGTGIQIGNSNGPTANLTVAYNIITHSNQGENVFGPGINLAEASYCSFIGNVITDRSGTPLQTHGIVEGESSDYNRFFDNEVVGLVGGGTANLYVIRGANSVTRWSGPLGQSIAVGASPFANIVPATTLDISGGFSQRENDITLANGTNDDVALPDQAGLLYVVGPTANYTITGIAGGTGGRRLTIVNYTAYSLTIAHNSGASSVGSRIAAPGAVNLLVGPYGTIDLIYLATAAAWMASAPSGGTTSAAISVFGTNVATDAAPYEAYQHLTADGYVALCGHLKSTSGTVTAGTTIATLDTTYRPDRNLLIPVGTSTGSITYANVGSNGTLSIARGLVAGGEYLRMELRYKRTNP